MAKKPKAAPRKRQPASTPRAIHGPHPVLEWISVKTAVPGYDRPVFVTDGKELAHAAREHSDRAGEHYHLVDDGSEFSNVSHWCEEPLLPNGKVPKR